MDNTFGMVMALAHAVVWAGTGVVLRALSTRLDAMLITGLRVTVGWLCILPVALLTARHEVALLTSTRVAFLFGSVLAAQVVGSTCSIRSLRILGIGRAFPIANSFPLFAILFEILDTRVPGMMVPGALLVLTGAYLIARSSTPVSGDEAQNLSGAELAAGVSLAVIAAVFWGLAAVLTSLGAQGISSVTANSVRLPAAIAVSLGVAGARGHLGALRRVDRRTVWMILIVGVIGYGIKATLYVNAIQYAGPSMTAIFTNSAPIFAVPLSAIFLGERPTSRTLIGTLLIVAGILLVV